MKYKISIDPGVSGTGIAVWKDREWSRLAPPIETANLYPKKTAEDWQERLWQVMSRLESYFFRFDINEAFIEAPEYFTGSAKGQAAAASGDLVALSAMVGAVAELCRQRRVHLVLIPVNVWKGQLPKEVVKNRLLRKLPILDTMKVTAHAWDAVGIGFYAKGHF